MKSRTNILTLVSLLALVTLSACASSTPPAETPAEEAPAKEEPASPPLAPVVQNTDRQFVAGIAGGVMTTTVTLEAEVVSVSQEKREAVLRGPEGNEVTIRVGEGAVNFYQVAKGDRVKVAMARELAVYVPEEGETKTEADSAQVMGARAKEGDTPAGAVVATAKITSTVEAMDLTARTATLKFEDGHTETFNVRPDVDMTKYKVGQKVVFLITEALALEVVKL